MANADRVITFCRPSRYGSVEDIRASMLEAYGSLGLGQKFEFITELEPSVLGQADLITSNSGHLRPFGADFFQITSRDCSPFPDVGTLGNEGWRD